MKTRASQFRHRSRHLWLPILRGWSGLPPGKLVDASEADRLDRRYLERLVLQHGPVFKAAIHNELTLCVVGLALGRRLLREHRENLIPLTLDIKTLTSAGFMRQMEGDVHIHYRRLVQEGLASTDWRRNSGTEETIRRGLLNYANASSTDASQWYATLTQISGSVLIELFFGYAWGSPEHDKLFSAFEAFGPHGLVWNLGNRQYRAYHELRALLLELNPQGGVMGSIQQGQPVDEAMLANLVFMLEMGRYDLRALLRWLSKHLADDSQQCQVADTDKAQAIVLETLRTDQSERLMRRIRKSFAFDGVCFPKGAAVRICMWESHHLLSDFNEPHQHRAERFLEKAPNPVSFSPFGLDHHQCPFASPVVHIGSLFVLELTRYRLAATGQGTETRGPYHWEPPNEFSITLQERQ